MTEDPDRHIEFGLFDPHDSIDVSERNLPHWFQPGAALFINMRLSDSLPEVVVERIITEVEAWLDSRSLPREFAVPMLKHDPTLRDFVGKSLNLRDLRELRKLTDRLVHQSLDECHGSCLLRDPACAKLVGDAFLYYDGIKCDIDRFVVMPNHVHAIAQFRMNDFRKIVGQSWMRFSARKINDLLGRTGDLWMGEAFDHIIRTPEQFACLQNYVANNPHKAKLTKGEYLYWERPL